MPVDQHRVQQLFAQATAIVDPVQRQAFLVDQCAGDGELLRRVTELLTAYDSPKPYLDQPTDLPETVGVQSRIAQQPGTTIAGRYKLLEAIAEGGMGTVWVAEQTHPIKRKVALKLIKPGMDSRQVLARFDAERQALALMDHPNIAKVYDGGVTEQGRPYFAMEYVKGMPLTKYCDQVRLSVKERLELFVPICQAVQHAHQKGIIHRDLKPSNVLVCLYDGKPVPKVIDFGLAKAMYQPLTEQTLHTGHGLMLGTPLYMSPEQAENNNLDVDTRSDVYSLGVMLYELLTGSTPLEKAQLKQAAFGEILRLIKEVEPPKPSARVSTSAHRASIAAQRSLDPQQLGRSISGDLDWIIMKALDKERNRRYESASGLARDIERFLNQEVVEACPPSTGYRLRKQFQKHRAAIATAAAFLLVFALAAVTSTWQAIRATRLESLASQQRDIALQNERQALKAKSAESDARVAEKEARDAEARQRQLAEAQRTEAEKQRDEAKRLQELAIARNAQLEKLSEAQRKSLYASDMNLVRLEAMRGNLPRMREILYEQLPIDRPDLRGFEWNYWYRYLTQAKRLRQFNDVVTTPSPAKPGVVLPGAKIVAVPVDKATNLVELASGVVLQSISYENNAEAIFARFAANGRSIFSQTSRSNSNNAADNLPTGVEDDWAPKGFVVYDPNGDPKHWTYPERAYGRVTGVRITEDGRYVAAIGKEPTHSAEHPACRIMVWDVDSKEVVLNRTENRILDQLVLSRDGSLAAAFCNNRDPSLTNEPDDALVVLDVKQDKVLGVLRYDDLITTANWYPDQRGIVFTTRGLYGNNRRELMRWSWEDEQPQRLSSEFVPADAVITMSSDGRWIAISSPNSSSVRLVDGRTGLLFKTVYNEASNIVSVNFDPTAKHLVGFSRSGEVVQWQLAPDDDRFALKSKPLPVATVTDTVHWKFSEDQNRMVYTVGTQFISVRSADGQELFHRETEGQNRLLTPPALSFNRSGDLLAIATENGSDFNDRTGKVELIDLREGKLRWSISPQLSFVSGFQIVFEKDSSMLHLSSGPNLLHIDVSSGAIVESKIKTAEDRFLVHEFRPSMDAEKTFVVGYQSQVTSTGPVLSAMVFDVSSGEQIGAIENQRINTLANNRTVASSLSVSPRGDRLTRLSGDGSVELWDCKSQTLLASLRGQKVLFSLDGSLVVVGSKRFETMEPPSQPGAFRRTLESFRQGMTEALSNASIYSTSNGQLLTNLNFAGDPPVELSLSADGKRLISFHGKHPGPMGSQAAHARVWDCATGQEILDLPIAMESRYYWDLQVSPSGDSLTALVFSGMQGGPNQVGSIVFNAAPLTPEADAQIVAMNWLKRLEPQTPLPDEIIKEIEANQNAKPLVRQTALALAKKIPFDAVKIGNRCLEIVLRSDLDGEQYEKALSWSQALASAEPNSPRTIALISAAQYRLGRFQAAMQTLALTTNNLSGPRDVNSHWELMRCSVEVLCLHQISDQPILAHRKAIELADAVHTILPEVIAGPSTVSTIIREALNTQGRTFSGEQLQARFQPNAPNSATASQSPTQLFSTERFFKFMDKNGDIQLSARELMPNKWELYARYDRDGVEGLSMSEWTAWSFVTAAQREAAARRVNSAQLALFARLDKDSDQQVKKSEAGAAWKMFAIWDTDSDDAISQPEFEQSIKSQIFVQVLLSSIRSAPQLSDDAKKTMLDIALEEKPHETNFLNLHAWLLSTTPVDSLRNGELAVKEALEACEITEFKIPYFIDTLAAAYAERGDFEKAVEYAERACAPIGAIDNESVAMRQRLELFKQGKPYRDAPSDNVNEPEPIATMQPLVSQSQLTSARRIRGGEPCWSADGKKLIHALTGFSPDSSYLQSLDLASGETKVLCGGGKRPACSPSDGTIAMERFEPSTGNSQIWLVDQDGSNARRLCDNGYIPRWTTDGNLCYLSLTGSTPQLQVVTPTKSSEPLWTATARLGKDLNMVVSPDAQRIAFSGIGKWSVVKLAPGVEIPTTVTAAMDRGRSDWSPDGKWIAYDATPDGRPGVYLVDVATLKPRLLADIGAVPRWSPDGETLALGLKSSNEILLLDLSPLKILSSNE